MRLSQYIFVILFSHLATAQADSTTINKKALIAPSILVTYGLVGTYTTVGQRINRKIRCLTYNAGNSTHVDDYLALAPSAAVYGLNVLGVKGKHNFKDRTIIIGTSYTMLLPVVLGTKKLTGIQRPDGSEYTSFPSGHTAFSFASAEFIRQEYKHKSLWYGVAGYTLATATAGLRIYNNKHWLADIAAGAGLGILSTQAAYWIHPWMSEKIFTKKNSTATLLPQLGTEQVGLIFSTRF